ncbi:MAG TPA: alkaline phosphatase family protein [bacterium]|nr:alkaline phosphatase family protein [bacterium]
MAASKGVNKAADGADVRGKIRHVFVLMMENRSFDHVFGRYTGSDSPARPLDNLVHSGWIKRSLANAQGRAFPLGPAVASDQVSPDPPHEMEDTFYQLTNVRPDRSPAAKYSYQGHPVTNQGFVKAYLETPEIAALPQVDPVPVIASWDPRDMGVLSALAQEYALCDRWFSSLPGPTWANRLFVHAGHSGGLDYSPDTLSCTDRFLVEGYDLGTHIFDVLGERAAIYSDGAIPLALCLKGIDLTGGSKSKIHRFHDFVGDLDAGALNGLEYVFIEPNYGKALGTNVTNEYDGGNSQHAVASFQSGEDLIATVYNALRNSKLWENSLLIVTWDEHGGFFDHCPPPSAKALVPKPGPQNYSHHQFSFNTLGVRVPALFISPYVKRGFIDGAVRDHSVIPNFIAAWFTGKALPQGRQPAKGGVTALSAQSGLFDWSLDPAAPRLPTVSLNWTGQAKLKAQAVASWGRGVLDRLRPTGDLGLGEASRTVKTRVVLTALAKGKSEVGQRSLRAATAQVGKPNNQQIRKLRTRDEHLDYLKKNTPN